MSNTHTLLILFAICFVGASAQATVEEVPPTTAEPATAEPKIYTTVNDSKTFKKLLENATDALVAFTTNDVLPAESEATLKSIATQFPQVLILHAVCGVESKICKHVCSDVQRSPEVVLAHYRSGRFNRVIRKKDDQSFAAFMANPYSNPCDDDPLTTNYTCVNTLEGFSEAISGASTVVTLFYAAWNKQLEDIKTVFSQIATTDADTAKFLAVDITSPQTGAIAQALDITLFPAIAQIDLSLSADCRLRVFTANVTNATEVVDWLHNATQDAGSKCNVEKLKNIQSYVPDVLVSVASTIPVVNQSTYDITINQTTSAVLMLIYSTACSDCAAAIAEFESAQPLIQAEGLNGSLLILDADQSLELVRRWKITSYPTIEYLLNGSFEFIIQREMLKTAADIVAFFRMTDEERRAFRKLWVKPFVFSTNLQRLNVTEAATQINATEHTFVMQVFSASIEQEIQMRKAVKELNKAIDMIAASNTSTAISFVLVNCTLSENDVLCVPVQAKNTTAAFVMNYYQNGSLMHQSVVEELVEPEALNAANTKSSKAKVKSRDFLRWAANVTGLPLNTEDHCEHKQKETAEKATKKQKKEKAAEEAATKKADSKTAKENEETAADSLAADEKAKEEKHKKEEHKEKKSTKHHEL